jgi:hypothetical protein
MEMHLGLRFAFTLVLAFVIGAGCASGGGRGGGGGGVDGGIRIDAGPMAMTDAGPTPAIDTGPMPMIDAGPMGVDSGPAPRDGGPPDAGPREPDAGPIGCTSAAECTDGRVCNGIERCTAGRCTPGTPVTCDDGISCTVDACTEPSATCTFTPMDALCGAGMRCTTTTGCMTTSMCSEMPCRLVAPQCGCAAGQGCYVDGAGTRSCQMAGTSAEGAACTATASCTPGNLCVNISAAPPGVNMCKRFCNADSDCVGAGSLCTGTLMGAAGVRLCSRACDPVVQTGCPTGSGCGIFVEMAGAMRYLTDCYAPVGSGAQGSPCVDDSTCQRGYACLDPDGPGGVGTQCLHYCNVLTGAGCPFGFTCYGFTTPVRIGGNEYGVCYF